MLSRGSSDASHPHFLRESWDVICDISRCYRCRGFVRIYYREYSSTHVTCSQCKRPMSVVQILFRNPELYRWYQQWGGVRLRPIGGGVARRTSGIASPSASPSSSSHSRIQSVAHNQETVDPAGPSSSQPPPPQERPSSSSVVPTTTGTLVSGSLPTPYESPPPDHVNFFIELFFRIPFRGQPAPPLPAVPEAAREAFTTVTVTSEHVEGRHGILRQVCAHLCDEANLEVGDQVKELPCKHLLIHTDCFGPWLQSCCSCPACGLKLPLRWRMMLDSGIQFFSCPFQEENDKGDEGAPAGSQHGGSGEAVESQQGGSGEAAGSQRGGSDEEGQASS